MDETSKTLRWHRDLLAPFLCGTGLDIGPGSDPVAAFVRRFDVEHGDAARIDEIVDDNFDYVWSSHCLERMPDPRDALQRWWSLVKPGGHLILVVPDEDLYEQGYFPSRFNSDHRATFTIEKSRSWSPVSVNLRHEIAALADSQIVLLEVQDDGLDRTLLATGPERRRPIEKVVWGATAAAMRLLGVSASRRLRIARRRGMVIDQTLLPEDRLAQIIAVVRRRELVVDGEHG
jgi:SAM-dependent methyltransferase